MLKKHSKGFLKLILLYHLLKRGKITHISNNNLKLNIIFKTTSFTDIFNQMKNLNYLHKYYIYYINGKKSLRKQFQRHATRNETKETSKKK